jgi:hypothetical protein
MTVPSVLVARWESAYRRYSHLTQVIAQAESDHDAARTMASASWDVATAWRDIATTLVLPWWTLAALRAASDAFEQQAHAWHARSTVEDGQPTIIRRPTVPKTRSGHV